MCVFQCVYELKHDSNKELQKGMIFGQMSV